MKEGSAFSFCLPRPLGLRRAVPARFARRASPGSWWPGSRLSDLQGAWANLRTDVVEAGSCTDLGRLLLHIDEAMNWESVRNLGHMKDTLLLVTNLAVQAKLPQASMEDLEEIRDTLDEAIEQYGRK